VLSIFEQVLSHLGAGCNGKTVAVWWGEYMAAVFAPIGLICGVRLAVELSPGAQ
jgi:hypothetical protein